MKNTEETAERLLQSLEVIHFFSIELIRLLAHDNRKMIVDSSSQSESSCLPKKQADLCASVCRRRKTLTFQLADATQCQKR